MPAPARLRRIKCGIDVFDNWVDMVMSTLERATNVTGSGGVDVRCGPQGTQISLNLLPFFAIAQSGSGGIPARSGGTLGKGTVTIQTLTFNSGNLTVSPQPTSDTAYHFGSTAVGATKYLVLVWVLKFWIVVWEDCA